MGKLRSSKLSSDKLPAEVKLPIETRIEARWIKKVMVTDPKAFQECVTKEKEFGIIKKYLWYIHRLEKQWLILQLKPELKSYKLE